MGVVSRARNVKIKLSMQDVLRSKSVVQLARTAKVLPSSAITEAHKEEESDMPFALSPIQSMYLKSAVKHDGEGRFNQSFALGVPRRVSAETIKKAIDSIVQRHSMLRARFARAPNGRWEQRIAKVGFLLTARCNNVNTNKHPDGALNLHLSRAPSELSR
jgi:hypothetical protein